MYTIHGSKWPFVCPCAVKKLLTHQVFYKRWWQHITTASKKHAWIPDWIFHNQNLKVQKYESVPQDSDQVWVSWSRLWKSGLEMS